MLRHYIRVYNIVYYTYHFIIYNCELLLLSYHLALLGDFSTVKITNRLVPRFWRLYVRETTRDLII